MLTWREKKKTLIKNSLMKFEWLDNFNPQHFMESCTVCLGGRGERREGRRVREGGGEKGGEEGGGWVSMCAMTHLHVWFG